MTPPNPHGEAHKSHRAGWLRAMVLGANDGIVSTACLVLGVAAAEPELGPIITAGIAGLVAGALSMAVGEWVSVGSQRDTEEADIARERWELANMSEREHEELVQIYVDKGLSRELAQQVASELATKNPLKVHLAEELGITEGTRARPMQAALSSASAFALGAALPLLAVVLSPAALRIATTIAVSVVALAGLGAVGARLGGARVMRPTVRVVLGGAAAMGITMGIGYLVGANIG